MRSIPGYQRLCSSSGGFLVDAQNVDVDDIVDILSFTIQSSKVYKS